MASAETVRAALLRGVAEAARAALDARATSVALLDERTGDLVFEAVAGGGGPELLGAHFRADEGIAGHVVQTGAAVAIDDLDRDPRFAHDIAVEAGEEHAMALDGFTLLDAPLTAAEIRRVAERNITFQQTMTALPPGAGERILAAAQVRALTP